MNVRHGLPVAIFAAWVAVATLGQSAPPTEVITVKLVLHPAAEPRPALKYQLLPPLVDRKPGNAALHYNRIPAEKTPTFASNDLWQKLAKYQEMPLAELRQPEVRKTIAATGHIRTDLARAARCEECDWGLLQRIRESENFYWVLLPEFQQSRQYARALAPWIRLQIAEGNFEEAVYGLQTGYSEARDVAKSPMVVTGLVGAAMAGMMSWQVYEFVQQPGAPNLYWALSTLPRPLIDTREAFQGEMYGLYLACPELRDLESRKYTPEHWQRLLEQVVLRLQQWEPGEVPQEYTQLHETAWMLRGYPAAKRFLIERGRSPAEIDTMPVAQAVLLATMRNYEELRDNLLKWSLVPYSEFAAGLGKESKTLSPWQLGDREVLPLASIIVPAVNAVRNAEVRIDRDIALLRTFELLRLYAAAHGGLPPESLKDITEGPVPKNPVRGEPFAYRRQGDVAIVEVPADFSSALVGCRAGLPSSTVVRYEIQFVRKGK